MGSEKRGLVRCFVSIHRLEGWRGLWRGVGPTSQRAALIAAVELPVYDGCKRRLRPALGDAPPNHLASSALASLGSAVASTPLDVIRVSVPVPAPVRDILLVAAVSNVLESLASQICSRVRDFEAHLSSVKRF